MISAGRTHPALLEVAAESSELSSRLREPSLQPGQDHLARQRELPGDELAQHGLGGLVAVAVDSAALSVSPG